MGSVARAMGVLLLAGFACRVRGQALAPLRPSGIAYDSAGDLLIADPMRDEVFEASVGGVLTVIAGTGTQGFGGDGGAASAALLNRPEAVAVGADGTIYIADTGNERVRAVSPTGVISTFAGDGKKGFGGDGGAATAAALSEPGGLATDGAGDLYIADTDNERVRVVGAGVISTFAGDGVDGFAGDGGAAAAAELNGPLAVAVDARGRLLIADTGNHRVRVVATDGMMATFAGSGVAGFAGDGGPAVAAELFLPSGVAVRNDGSVLIADAGNRRLRVVDAGGAISTIAGNGVQGNAANGVDAVLANLNEPGDVSVSAFGDPVIADAGARTVMVLLPNGGLYLVDALTKGARVSSVDMSAPQSALYGTGSVAVSVAGAAGTPRGAVSVLDGAAKVGTAELTAAGTANLDVGTLDVGAHALQVAYAGDGVNPAADSAVAPMMVTPAPVVAMANAGTIAYGQTVPLLTGSETGILPRDLVGESVVFTSSAAVLSPVGSYAIAGSLQGPTSMDYSLTMAANSGALMIVQASSTTTVTANAAYVGLPMTLYATVAPEYAGSPSGMVEFDDGGAVIASGAVAKGAASAVYLAPASGAHTITARYGGDANFIASVSAPVVATVNALPDFAMSVSGSGTQLVQEGSLATFTVMLTPNSPAFSSAVSLSASGLPAGTVVTFAPQQVVPSAGGSAVAVTVATAGLLAMRRSGGGTVVLALLPGCLIWLVLGGTRRKRVERGALLAITLLLTGCGARSVPEAAGVQKSFTVHVTATATSLAGTLLSHSVDFQLTVQ